ncbi:hypothetical protein LCGC14_1815660 [marine sediment metagenome]|uniref:Uncharacterized protein n=1 Tax=marine sediment metagenome TaxID=412755 RepID=A0A0F9J0A1_9ZZZZ
MVSYALPCHVVDGNDLYSARVSGVIRILENSISFRRALGDGLLEMPIP